MTVKADYLKMILWLAILNLLVSVCDTTGVLKIAEVVTK